MVDQSQLVLIPPSSASTGRCLLACGVITGVGAVLNTAQLAPGSSAVIIGAGGVGVNAIQGAALAGALPIIAVDVLPAQAPGRAELRRDPRGGRPADRPADDSSAS